MFVLFVCLGFGVCLLENVSLIWSRHNYRWRASNFDLCSAFMAIEQWGIFSVPHLLWHGASVMVNSEDPWHSHLLPSIKQWSCHYLFLQLMSVAAQPSAWRSNALTHITYAAVWTPFRLPLYIYSTSNGNTDNTLVRIVNIYRALCMDCTWIWKGFHECHADQANPDCRSSNEISVIIGYT